MCFGTVNNEYYQNDIKRINLILTFKNSWFVFLTYSNFNLINVTVTVTVIISFKHTHTHTLKHTHTHTQGHNCATPACGRTLEYTRTHTHAHWHTHSVEPGSLSIMTEQ